MPHVLLVEDDPFTARRLLRLLVSRGVCRVVLATTVAQAMGLPGPSQDWVILDMNLPDGTGPAVREGSAGRASPPASSSPRRRRTPPWSWPSRPRSPT